MRLGPLLCLAIGCRPVLPAPGSMAKQVEAERAAINTPAASSAAVEALVIYRARALEKETRIPDDVAAVIALGELVAGMDGRQTQLAWGSPCEETQGGNRLGRTETWVYCGVQREVAIFCERFCQPRRYVFFINGRVSSWQGGHGPVGGGRSPKPAPKITRPGR